MLSSKLAFPLVALQYNELHIHVTLRPVREWFTINNVSTTSKSNSNSLGERIQPNFADPKQAFYRFIHPTPQIATFLSTNVGRNLDENASNNTVSNNILHELELLEKSLQEHENSLNNQHKHLHSNDELLDSDFQALTKEKKEEINDTKNEEHIFKPDLFTNFFKPNENFANSESVKHNFQHWELKIISTLTKKDVGKKLKIVNNLKNKQSNMTILIYNRSQTAIIETITIDFNDRVVNLVWDEHAYKIDNDIN